MRQRNTLRGTELFMSPALYDGLKHELNDVSHNPFKSDVFSLGFCFLYASALNFNLLYQVRDILDNKNINNILHKFLDKCYSEKFIALIASMTPGNLVEHNTPSTNGNPMMKNNVQNTSEIGIVNSLTNSE